MIKVPELLMPAGNLDKLKTAISYGADAVYLAGEKYGLRAACDNFTFNELAEGLEFAHRHQAKVYLVVNSFFHDQDFAEFAAYIKTVGALGVDAYICSDIGVITSLKEILPEANIHLSTQASCLNTWGAKFWRSLGVSRIIVGREVSIELCGKIRREAKVEVESFIHGSLCMAYSGNCVLSNYTRGRDSNRGGCAHSCRFNYELHSPETSKRSLTSFMSSKDLQGLRLLPHFIKQGIDSVKVEGRMKSFLYLSTVTKIYRLALDSLARGEVVSTDQWQIWERELLKVATRGYTSGSLLDSPGADSVAMEDRELGESCDWTHAGRVFYVDRKNARLLLEVRAKFTQEHKLEVLPYKKYTSWPLELLNLTNLSDVKVSSTKPNTFVWLHLAKEDVPWSCFAKGMILRSFIGTEPEALSC